MLSIKLHTITKILNSSLIKLPSPSFISYKWNFGFILLIVLSLQIVSGLFLTIHYRANIITAFNDVVEICRNVNNGWFLRAIHANGASFFFLVMYIHIGRGLYYFSFNLKPTWNMGVLIILIRIITAFVGYVLPWGQMSFWGATVITNLLSVIPYLGTFIVEWVWGGFSVRNPTLNRFYTFHFLFPFWILMIVLLHLIFLHEKGSRNPLGINSNLDKVEFHPYFTWKDIFSFIVIFIILIIIIIQAPYILGDSENFIPSNPLVTPVHIQPEWYLLFAYSILRAIPNKLGGVIFLLISILMLMVYSAITKFPVNSSIFTPANKLIFWAFIYVNIILTWLGICPVEDPFIFIGQIFTLLYFLYFLIHYYIMKSWFRNN